MPCLAVLLYHVRMWLPRVGLSLLLALSALGCRFDPRGLSGQDVGADAPHVVDAPGDALGESASDLPPKDITPDLPILDSVPSDATILCSNWTPAPKHFKPCDVGSPVAGLALSTAGVWIYNTDTGVLTNPPLPGSTSPQSKLLTLGGVEARVVSVRSLVVDKGVTLRAIGSRPLVLAVWHSATINGKINVSSTHNPTLGTFSLGAGTNPGACASVAPTAGQESNVQGGGGGGGGFGGDGGDGGVGDYINAAKGDKGSAVAAPTVVRGGCAGAKGGVATGGEGGPGGGAVQLTARLMITLSGVMHAGGAGGEGGGPGSQSGGGGGGSGGYLGLEAPAVVLTSTAVLAANGGGGGGGAADLVFGYSGANGPASAAGAAGGAGGASGKGGAGGVGGHKGALAGGTGKDSMDGAGGGGGGAGHLVITASIYRGNGATISAKAKTP